MKQIICDKCDQIIDMKTSWIHPSHFSIHLTAGSGSKFGAGNSINLDLCELCLYDILEREALLTKVIDEEN